MYDTQPQASRQRPKTYLIGSIRTDRDWLNCCPTATTLPSTEKQTGLPAIIAIPCRRWGCRWCGQRKAFHLACRTEAAKPTKFITVTSDAKLWTNPRECYDFTRRKVADFAKRIRKNVGAFEYVRVLERHANGLPHYHFVARCPYIPQKWLSAQWAELTGSIIVDIRTVDKRTNVFRYILKYLCKQEYIPWTDRRVSWSKQFFPPKDTIDLRPNPYDVKKRVKCHPTAYAQRHYFGRQLEERRPGVWVVITPDMQTEIATITSVQQKEMTCRQSDLPLKG